MNTSELLADAARRPLDAATAVLNGIDDATLHAMPGGQGNSIAWLIWHAARQMDYQLSELTGRAQVWGDDWAEKTGISREATEFGFGDTHDDVAALRTSSAAELFNYFSSVVESLISYTDGLSEPELDEIIDTRWDPPVSRGVRLVSIIDDAAVHLGQAAYARGLIAGWTIGY